MISYIGGGSMDKLQAAELTIFLNMSQNLQSNQVILNIALFCLQPTFSYLARKKYEALNGLIDFKLNAVAVFIKIVYDLL